MNTLYTLKKRMLTAACFGVLIPAANAQTFQILDENNVSARISDDGIFFNDPTNSVAGYEVPKGSGSHAIFAGGFWFGGTDVNGQLKLAAQRYSGNGQDYWAGPATRHNPNEWAPNDWATIQNYFGQTIWSVTQAEIADHIVNYQSGTYTMPADIANWPAHGDTTLGTSSGMLGYIAPFVDVNNNGKYDPMNGDYPCIKGDRATYLIMTDAGGLHTASNSQPIGIELHYMFYQYSSVPELQEVTFVDVEVVNMSTQTLYETTASFFLDTDIGYYNDDYVGTDTLRNMIFAYNGDNLDENGGGLIGYGTTPPALGMIVLSNSLDYSIAYTSGAAYPYNDPYDSQAYYSAMRGNWSNDSDQLDNLNQPTDYFYSGDPNDANGWSEVTESNSPGDRRMIASTDFETFTPDFTTGATGRIKLSYALVFAQGTDNLNSVSELKNSADFVQSFYDGLSSSCFDLNLADIPVNGELEFNIHPNPSNGSLTVELGNLTGNETLKVFDAAGRVVHEQPIQNAATLIHLNVSEGLYHLEVSSDNARGIKKFIVR